MILILTFLRRAADALHRFEALEAQAPKDHEDPNRATMLEEANDSQRSARFYAIAAAVVFAVYLIPVWWFVSDYSRAKEYERKAESWGVYVATPGLDPSRLSSGLRRQRLCARRAEDYGRGPLAMFVVMEGASIAALTATRRKP